MTALRPGFTLIEVVVALVLTGTIALASYVALEAGTGTRERVEGPLADRERALLGRTILEDALRHVTDDASSSQPFARRGDASDGDVLSFTTRGVVPPLGATGRWRVVVRRGLLEATPIDDPGPRLLATLPGVVALRISTLRSGVWTEVGEPLVRAPEDLRVEFLTRGLTLAPLAIHMMEGGFR